MTFNQTNRTAPEALVRLRTQFPDSPFLALGQTVFWDEPMKAVLRRLLDAHELGGEMVLGVHDTDYFAKSKVKQSGKARFALMPHNDGTTKDLWSAAGEVSTLFGSETFPGKQDFARFGVPFERVAKESDLGRQGFIDEMTEAWGWRGLVYTGSRDLIVNSLSLKEVGDGILEMLSWGFENALPQLIPGCCQDKARGVADQIMGWCRSYREGHPDATLTDLFQHCLARLHELLLGHALQNTTVTSTTKLLRFAPDTACLPRFKFVDLFLKPETRELAISAYNDALAGSEMYALDKFGAGALPFDIISPEYGRGTLRVTPRVVFVETRKPIAIGLKKPVESVQELAEILHRKLGDRVTLVGKAVSLVSMLAQEFLFVFNEEGSMYVRRTRQMNDTLIRAGVRLDMRPILRIRYETWDSLSVASSTLRLPDHLAAAFGARDIASQEFGTSWKEVMAGQRSLCKKIAELRKPLELLAFLEETDPAKPWEELSGEYRKAKETLQNLRMPAAELDLKTKKNYTELNSLREMSQTLQTAKGNHFRSVKLWDKQETEKRTKFNDQLQEVEDRKSTLIEVALNLKSRRLEIERGLEQCEARRTIHRIENEAELARLRLIRNALLATEGLAHTNHRPSAWWLPILDSSGDWFDRIAETSVLYLEPLVTEPAIGRK